jgi:hypothetical protein
MMNSGAPEGYWWFAGTVGCGALKAAWFTEIHRKD